MVTKKRAFRSRERERFWRKVIAGQPRSGMGVAAWCRKHGVSAPAFYVWRQRLAKRDAAGRLRRLSLLPVEVIGSAPDPRLAALEIELPSQVRVRVGPSCELGLLEQVLKILTPERPEAERC